MSFGIPLRRQSIRLARRVRAPGRTTTAARGPRDPVLPALLPPAARRPPPAPGSRWACFGRARPGPMSVVLRVQPAPRPTSEPPALRSLAAPGPFFSFPLTLSSVPPPPPPRLSADEPPALIKPSRSRLPSPSPAFTHREQNLVRSPPLPFPPPRPRGARGGVEGRRGWSARERYRHVRVGPGGRRRTPESGRPEETTIPAAGRTRGADGPGGQVGQSSVPSREPRRVDPRSPVPPSPEVEPLQFQGVTPYLNGGLNPGGTHRPVPATFHYRRESSGALGRTIPPVATLVNPPVSNIRKITCLVGSSIFDKSG